jgi:hypothetical protein
MTDPRDFESVLQDGLLAATRNNGVWSASYVPTSEPVH